MYNCTMDIIVDASAILAVLLNEPQKERILELTRGVEFIAPSCIEYEIGNAVSALFRRKLLEVSDGILVWHAYNKVPIRQLPPDFHESLIIAGTEGLYAYDAYYLALAGNLRLPLLTLDAVLKAAASRRGVTCLEV